MKIIGVDEAGRGPVIGPMVMAGAMIEEEDLSKLHSIGVKDSKMLSPNQRESMFSHIKNTVKSKIIIINPPEIDAAVSVNKLNYLEADKTAEIINFLKPDKAYIDCPSTNIAAYKGYLERHITCKVILFVEHKADAKYEVASAASILAKVTRDREIDKLKMTHGIDFGSGYPSDPKTQDFLKKNYNKYNFFRKSWATYKNVATSQQKGLGEF